MQILEITQRALPDVALFMNRMKPDWWDYKGAFAQLSDIHACIESVGWYLTDDDNHPKGFLFCREFLSYQILEVECCGYDDAGEFKLEHKLDALFDVAEAYAREKEYCLIRTGISSEGFSIHEKELYDIPKAMQELKSDRIDYDWYLQRGYSVIGICPNVYGKGIHMILLGKSI